MKEAIMLIKRPIVDQGSFKKAISDENWEVYLFNYATSDTLSSKSSMLQTIFLTQGDWSLS